MQKEKIYRFHFEKFAEIELPRHRVREKYPWEDRMIGEFSKITKEHFRCRGSSHNPLRMSKDSANKEICLLDCGGIERHSLPTQGESETIYPILIDLLNHVQRRTERKVIVTCGHRCPIHNAYSDSSKGAQKSKHLIGAEVDFYVQGLEESPEKIVKVLMEYYENQGELSHFVRYEKDDAGLRIAPWYNKEIMIKLHQVDEGRDFDNRHPYPYITIELRYDRHSDRRVYMTWHRAFNGYMRW
jgi:hypothetical protein